MREGEDGADAGPSRVLLVSPPWRLANWPSLAIGVLKAYLVANGVDARASHLHLDVARRIGHRRYASLADQYELAEAVYGAVLEPDRRDELLAASADAETVDRDALAWVATSGVETARAALEEAVAGIALDEFDLVAISVGALQLTAAIFVARLVSASARAAAVVLGGSGLPSGGGRALLAGEPSIDAVVEGEGEIPLLALASLPRPWTPDALSMIPSVWHRAEGGQVKRSSGAALSIDLRGLPTPDYEEYFRVADAGAIGPDRVVLPLEASRGCAWEHRRNTGTPDGCSFCGLYRTAPGHRRKAVSAVANDVRSLVARHRVLDVSLVDAYLPKDDFGRSLLTSLAALDEDITLFAELRCDLDDTQAQLLAAAGTRRVQLGVESFDSPTLRLMNKGLTAAAYVQSMKLCEEYALPYQYNLITHLPGVDTEAVSRCVAVARLLRGFRPPSISRFYLDRGSPMYADPHRFGLDLSGAAPRSGFLPSRLADAPVTVAVAGRFAPHADDAWGELAREVQDWREHHAALAAAGLRALEYRDGGTFVQIVDRRQRDTRELVLEGDLAAVLRGCARVTTAPRLTAALGMGAARLDACLSLLVELGLVLRDERRFIALAPRRRRSHP